MSAQKHLSPYKKIQAENQQYVSYVNIKDLDKNKPYLMYKLEPTNHDTYGPGERAFLRGRANKREKTQLPSKYLKKLGVTIEIFRSDIEQKKYPFLVFRGQLLDNSYHIEILEFSHELLLKYKKWEDVEESHDDDNDSLDSVDLLLANLDKEDNTTSNDTGSKRKLDKKGDNADPKKMKKT